MEFPQQLNEAIAELKRNFGAKCPRKLVGTLTVELIRQELSRREIPVSHRDVFIKGMTREVDLLIHRPQSRPQHGLIHEPRDVLIVLEVKGHGSYGQQTLQSVKSLFEEVNQTNADIRCMYVAAIERKGYKWVATQANLGCPDVYTLSWYHRDSDYPGTPSADWGKFLERVSDILRRADH